jgi:Uma2 family endonuclease
MDAVVKTRFTEAEYLARERAGTEKHEFINGEILAMAGGSPDHALLSANVISALKQRLRGGPCRVYTSDLRVNVADTKHYTYPDVTVICGETLLHPSDPNTVRNPRLLVEVLSDATELHDRGAKWAHYRHLPSLQEYVLVSQGAQQVEHYRRVESGWLLTEYEAGAVVPLPCLGIEVPVGEIYEGVVIAGATAG